MGEMSLSLESLFRRFSDLLVLDIETTGLDPVEDEVIEIGGLLVSIFSRDLLRVTKRIDTLVKPPKNRTLPRAITNLTGITGEALASTGMSRREAAAVVSKLVRRESTLLVGYNVQFDLLFIRKLLNEEGFLMTENLAILDVLAVFRDRRSYPNKLTDAIVAYGLEDKVCNAHRAIGDAIAVLEVLRAMWQENDNLDTYIAVLDCSS